MNMEYIGRQIKTARLEKGLTQSSLAEKLSISQNYIGMIERGHTEPSLHILIAIADALDVTAGYILDSSNKIVDENRCLQYREDIAQRIDKFDQNRLLFLLDIIDSIERHN